MSKGQNISIVLFGLLSNLYGLYGVGFGNPIPVYGGYFQFLTIVGLLVATFMFSIRLINLLTGTLNIVYESLSAITTPIEGLISLIYWPLVLYDRSLLVPENTVFDLPLSLDIALHLIPAIVCWVDLMKFNTTFKRSPIHVICIYLFAFGYYVWVNICHERNGFWAYPALAMMDDTQRIGFFVGCTWVCSGLYRLIVKGHSVLHPPQKEKKL